MTTYSMLQGVYKLHTDALSALQQLRDAVDEPDFTEDQSDEEMAEMEQEYYEAEFPYRKERGPIYNLARAKMGEGYRLKDDAGCVETFWIEAVMVHGDTDESDEESNDPDADVESRGGEVDKGVPEKESSEDTSREACTKDDGDLGLET